jgi:F0F1-type ATP synthase assembly protein I
MNTQTTRVNYELTARIIANGSKPTTKQAQKRNWEVISAVSILAILVGSVLLAVHYGLINNGI